MNFLRISKILNPIKSESENRVASATNEASTILNDMSLPNLYLPQATLKLIGITKARQRISSVLSSKGNLNLEPLMIDWLAFECVRCGMAKNFVRDFLSPVVKTPSQFKQTKRKKDVPRPKFELLPLAEQSKRQLIRFLDNPEIMRQLDAIVDLSYDQKKQIEQARTKYINIEKPDETTLGLHPGIIFKLNRNILPFAESEAPHLDLMHVMGRGREKPWAIFFRMTAYIILRSFLPSEPSINIWTIISEIEQAETGKSFDESMRKRLDWGFNFWLLSEEVTVMRNLEAFKSLPKRDSQGTAQIFSTILDHRINLYEIKSVKRPFCEPKNFRIDVA